MSDVYSTTKATIENQERQYGVIQKNIANAETEGYYKRDVKYVSDPLVGAKIADVQLAVDQSLLRNRDKEQSALSAVATEDRYLKWTLDVLGRPEGLSKITNSMGDNSLLNSFITDFFDGIYQFELSNNDSEKMSGYVSKINASTEKLNLLVENLTEIRMQADKEIALAVEVVNEGLFKIGELTNKRLLLKTDSQYNQEALNDVDNEIDRQLANIARFIDIKPYYSNGNLVISTANGANIFDGSIKYQLDFTQTRSQESYSDPNYKFPALSVSSGEGLIEQELVTAGTQENIRHLLKGGELLGLFRVRDKIVPDLLKQINEFTDQFSQQVNAVYSAAVPDRGYAEMVSAYEFQDSDLLAFSEGITIVFFNDNGVQTDIKDLDLSPGYAPGGISNIGALISAFQARNIDAKLTDGKLVLKPQTGGRKFAILNENSKIAVNRRDKSFNDYFGFSQLFEHQSTNSKPGTLFTSTDIKLSDRVVGANRVLTSKIQKNKGGKYIIEENNKDIFNKDMLNVRKKEINFNFYGSDYTTNLDNYAKNVLLDIKRKESIVAEGVKSAQIGYESINDRIQKQAGVDVNLQVYKVAELAKIQNGNMKVFQTFNQFWEKLFSVI